MRILFYLPVLVLFTKCARQTQPTGGPKDVNPPVLISSNPNNGEKNFHGDILELTFDEYVKLKDPKEEILITPSPGVSTRFSAKKNKVFISPDNKFLDTTTYSIAFREGIQDINESNPAEDLHLAFSTGPIIDSLKIIGTVSELFKDKIPEKITIGLYQSDTFDIFKHTPPLFSKSDKKGNFSILNLKAGQYFVYAFDDKNKNHKVDSKTERFGFLARSINLPEDTDTLQINLFHQDSRKIKLTSLRNTSTISIIRFNKPIDKLRISTDTARIIYTYGDATSEAIIFKEFPKNDSVQIRISATDSISNKIDTVTYLKYSDSKIIEERFKISEWKTSFDPTNNYFEAQANTNKLLLSLNYDSIYIQIDTTTFQPIKPEEIAVDTLRKTVQIKTTLKIEPKSTSQNPILVLGKGALVSIDKDSSKAQNSKIKIPQSENTGTLSLEIITQQPHFEVLLTTTKDVPIKSFKDLKKHTFTYLDPAEYKITIIIDTNNNGKWDPGNFYRKQEPEKVILYKTIENKNSFPIRANWELGPLTITF